MSVFVAVSLLKEQTIKKLIRFTISCSMYYEKWKEKNQLHLGPVWKEISGSTLNFQKWHGTATKRPETPTKNLSVPFLTVFPTKTGEKIENQVCNIVSIQFLCVLAGLLDFVWFLIFADPYWHIECTRVKMVAGWHRTARVLINHTLTTSKK